MKKPNNPKEKNLVKGALRRIFSRSDLRRQALAKNLIAHSDPERPRVTKWSWCTDCGVIEASYKMEVDHVVPVVAIDESLDAMTWDEVVERIWCAPENLQVVCKDCHKEKTRLENKARRQFKKGK